MGWARIKPYSNAPASFTHIEDLEERAVRTINDVFQKTGITPKEAALVLAVNNSPYRAWEMQNELCLNSERGNGTDVPAVDITTKSINALDSVFISCEQIFERPVFIEKDGVVYQPREEGLKPITRRMFIYDKPLAALRKSFIQEGRNLKDITAVVYIHTQKALAQTVSEKVGIEPNHAIDVTASGATLNYALAIANRMLLNCEQFPDYPIKYYIVAQIDIAISGEKPKILPCSGALVLENSDSPGFVYHKLAAGIFDDSCLSALCKDVWVAKSDCKLAGKFYILSQKMTNEIIHFAKKENFFSYVKNIFIPQSGKSYLAVPEIFNKAVLSGELKKDDLVAIMSFDKLTAGVSLYKV